jgi:serine/threonine protein kinase
MIGKSLGHYIVQSRLGHGGMGEVYLALDKRLDRRVALKFLPPKYAAQKDLLGRFRREAKVLASLNHPNIVTIYAVEEIGDSHFLAMEYIEGRNLADIMSERPIALKQFFELSVPLADALSVAHERGIIHCDLKPANIMVSSEGRVKILDFGLAKLRQLRRQDADSRLETEPVTLEGTIHGTVPYMSPEQVRGEAIDHRSDIFSLGVILYELVTGRRPFQGETTAGLMNSILTDTPAPAHNARSELPSHLSHVIGRCLIKETQRRLQATLDLRNELEALQQDLVTGPVKVVHSIAVLPFVDMSPEKDQDHFCEGMAEEIINALAGIEGLRVTSRTSAFQFKGKNLDSRSIGEGLGVDTLVEGSVRKSGSHLRITAQLINVNDGYQRWSRRYDRELKDVFAIQDEIAQHIVESLRFALGPQQTPLVHKSTTDDVQAYDYYLRGRRYFYHLTRRGLLFVHVHVVRSQPGPARSGRRRQPQGAGAGARPG